MDFGRYFSAFIKYASHLRDNINISVFAALEKRDFLQALKVLTIFKSLTREEIGEKFDIFGIKKLALLSFN